MGRWPFGRHHLDATVRAARAGGAAPWLGLALAVSANGQCLEDAKLLAFDGAQLRHFGWSAAISAVGGTVIVGAPDDGHPQTRAGSAYVFTRNGLRWKSQAKLFADNAVAGNWFGRAVIISPEGDHVLVGAPLTNVQLGSIYVFERLDGTWIQTAEIFASDADTALFGWTLALSADGMTLIAGSFEAAHVLVREDSAWVEQARLTPLEPNFNAGFGSSVAISGDGDTVAIGAPELVHLGTGTVYVFHRLGSRWQQQAKLVPDGVQSRDAVGHAVGLTGDGDTLLVGAPWNDEVANSAGAVYVFVRQNGTWTQTQELHPLDASDLDNFGAAIAVASGVDRAVIAAPWVDTESAALAGTAYLWAPQGSTWVQEGRVGASDATHIDGLGYSGSAITPDGDTVVVPAPFDDALGTEAGSAYVFSPVGDDVDADGALDPCDNCPTEANSGQADCDDDGLGDVCAISGGMAEDCNVNALPDDCELKAESRLSYVLDDGRSETHLGIYDGGDLIWFNQYAVEPGAETIVAVAIAWGHVAAGTPTTFAIWDDPDNDGDPTDAVLLATVVEPVARPMTDFFTVVSLPPTFVGNPGDSFFVGAHIAHEDEEFPTSLDTTSPANGRSWVAIGSDIENLPNNAAGPYLLDQTSYPGNWMMRALSDFNPDCGGNGVLDECEIMDGVSPDRNANGVPDGCDADLDEDGAVGGPDLQALLAAWGPCPDPAQPCPADFDGDGSVDINDFLFMLASWG